ncbi:hypothetical protein CPC08DRAFT_629091 [Agrocybe pediades]|nr:hypothetical protein CPC08DRAFT_629091 [Agrocybe pediades]
MLPADKAPWRPFRTREDFELAEIVLDTHMNARQTRNLFDLHSKIIPEDAKSRSRLTIEKPSELRRIWDIARQTRAEGFIEHPLNIPYKDRHLTYRVWVRNIWDWCASLLRNPQMIRHFRWDAIQNYQYTSAKKWERFISEPWTANAWWEYQTRIGGIDVEAKPFAIILYADKTRLSSFGTEKGYPVLVRCANLPASIRNGAGVGGARLVGWLPIPEELASETGKKRFINHKREVWHEAVAHIFASVQGIFRHGTSILCGDGVYRNIFPHVLMISADYEEQCMMALVRGQNASFPCPICLVPKEEIPNLSTTYPNRTSATMQAAYAEAQTMNSKDKEKSLQSVGLRDVRNMFWDLPGTDVYSALSWDRLHAYHGGLFSDHLLEEFKYILEKIVPEPRRASATAIDDALKNMPRWPGLNHYDALSKTGEFADGTKFEDLSKVIIHASLHMYSEERCKEGFALLRLIQSYLDLDMFSSLTMQTEATILRGREALRTFQERLHDYIKLQVRPDKQWDFPKLHTHQHMFDDILSKGVTRNFNTKPNEKLNGPLKKFYRNHTNFKNVASQVLRVNEMDLVANIIRSEITSYDKLQEEIKAKTSSRVRSSDSDALEFERVLLGSRCRSISLSIFESEPHLQQFPLLRRKLNKYLSNRLKGARVNLQASHEVTPYAFLDVSFSSVVNWDLSMNTLRTYEEFHHNERYDFALVKVDKTRFLFAQIHAFFTIKYQEVTYAVALAVPFDAPRAPQNRRRDELLSLTRVKPRQDFTLIDINSIVRGAMLAEDCASNCSERLVVNSIDEDMWLRMQSLVLATNANM